MIVEGSSSLGHLSKEGAREMHRFLRESDFCIVCLHVNLNSKWENNDTGWEINGAANKIRANGTHVSVLQTTHVL